MDSNKKILFAAIRIHGKMKLQKKIVDTLGMLRLYKQNTCIILPSTKQCIGMLVKLKDCITWGEINKETFLALLEKRGKLMGNRALTEGYMKEKTGMDFSAFADALFDFKKTLRDVPGLKPFFRLSPPRHGFGTKGVKQPFSKGGVLGYRKDKINEMIERMI